MPYIRGLTIRLYIDSDILCVFIGLPIHTMQDHHILEMSGSDCGTISEVYIGQWRSYRQQGSFLWNCSSWPAQALLFLTYLNSSPISALCIRAWSLQILGWVPGHQQPLYGLEYVCVINTRSDTRFREISTAVIYFKMNKQSLRYPEKKHTCFY